MAAERLPAQPPDPYPYVDLRKARLCLDCEVIFDAPQCPACTSETFIPITRWVRPTERRIEARPVPPPAPPETTSRPRRILKKSLYVGLGAYGVWKMLFEPPKPSRRKPQEPKS